ncbi:hypothetical protein KCH_12830 [Kitasatospora cheerisanensis KCTC 2395]|uniref:Response regulatory domain-containing protein n=1 Tax=Kitasatospora cheerisanensis KCTC 2395 TaxID=1348663 RepID=A0A066Z0B2_9ACTN|nr:hypothetical protein KCH_12830 [Kitasatospora cheerisanensis KCTC 2395]
MDRARDLLPGVALVDIRVPGADGIEASRRIAADLALSGVHVVVLTGYGLDDFLHVVRVAARGDAPLAQPITRRLIDRHLAQPITRRLREAVALVAQGPSNPGACRAAGDQPGDGEAPPPPGEDRAARPRPGPTRRGGPRIGPGDRPPRLTPGLLPARVRRFSRELPSAADRSCTGLLKWFPRSARPPAVRPSSCGGSRWQRGHWCTAHRRSFR